MGIKNNNSNTRSLLEKISKGKATGLAKKDPKVKKRREVLRGIRKSDQDKLDEAESPPMKLADSTFLTWIHVAQVE